jgi:DNA helicase HerA-like ATPase
MGLLTFEDKESFGKVISVDTASALVAVVDDERMRSLHVNRLVALQSARPGQYLIGLIQRINRDTVEEHDDDGATSRLVNENRVRISLLGTFLDRRGARENLFVRTLETVPEIDASAFALEGDRLTKFMGVISELGKSGKQALCLGNYTLDDKADAYLNGNRLFQRHAVVVGSTGSGKSWTVAQMLEQIAGLPSASAIVLDVHGEYASLRGDGIRQYRVAGPADLDGNKGISDGVLFLPYWLLTYEDLIAMLVDRSDQNAPNQAMVVTQCVVNAKRAYLEKQKKKDVLANFTVDSPVPFDLDQVVTELQAKNTEKIEGSRAGSEKQGPFYDKLSRLITRLEAKWNDRRLGFMFRLPKETMDYDWLAQWVSAMLLGTSSQPDKRGGVKIIDLSEVPSDILPLMASLIARLVFLVQQWTPQDKRHPIAVLCEEAHLYIPNRSEMGGVSDSALRTFERVAKEGRKYGVGLVVISQRPSEVNRTVLSQCNNVIALRLTNGDDQNVIQKLLPDNLGGFTDLLPILDTGEALVVGDASLLPTRVRIREPKNKPLSGTVEFWDRWAAETAPNAVAAAVESLRRQTQA